MSAALSLQGAIVAALKADPDVDALVAGRVYDRPPQDVVFPFVEVGDFQETDAGAGCMEDAAEVFVDVHAWSRSIGKVEAHRLAGAIKAALHITAPMLAGNWRCVELAQQSTRVLTDSDGITAHAVITMRAMIEPLV
jgi:hypothetical protein